MRIVEATTFERMLDDAARKAFVVVEPEGRTESQFVDEVRTICAQALAERRPTALGIGFMLVFDLNETEPGVSVGSVWVLANCGGAAAILDDRV